MGDLSRRVGAPPHIMWGEWGDVLLWAVSTYIFHLLGVVVLLSREIGGFDSARDAGPQPPPKGPS